MPPPRGGSSGDALPRSKPPSLVGLPRERVIRRIIRGRCSAARFFSEFAQAVERASVSPELRRRKQRITAADQRQNSNEQPRISGIFTTTNGAPSLTAPAAAVFRQPS